jgi:subtilisin-like proprotein convertase family protein
MRAQLVVGGYLAKAPRLTPAKVGALLAALLAALLGAVVALGLAASAASAATFSNTEGITINDAPPDCAAPGTATPYPSKIEVSGLGTSIADVNVTVRGLTHTAPDDVAVLLVSPAGDSTLLMRDSGGLIPVSGIDLTFDDAASGFLPDDDAQLTSGTYRSSWGPTTWGCFAPASFPADAPAGPYSSSLEIFNGTNPNGTWKLYVIDDAGGDSGSITGWSLDISTTVPTTKAQCKKGSWRDFGYPDQGTCISFVNENRP